jgi:uncharacterized protein (DUF488 family)
MNLLDQPIYTIGYGGRPISDFIDLLRQYGIRRLVDIRSLPTSRFRPDYRKAALQAHLEGAGIEYIFMGETLGGKPKDPACLTDGQVDFEKLRQQPFFRWGMEALKSSWQEGAPLAVMCAEQKPEACHRTHLIGAALVEMDIPVVHIDEHGALKNQAEVAGPPDAAQMRLF